MDEEELKKALVITNEIGKYHDKVVAMIQNAEEGVLHSIVYVRLMQNMSKQYIDTLKEDANNEEKSVIDDCIAMVDEAREKGVYKIYNNERGLQNNE